MKLYRTRTQAEYDWLARELSKKGMVSYIPRHEQGGDIVVYADEKEGYLSYSDLDYAEKECPNEPIIEVSDLMKTTDHDYLMDKLLERNNKPEAYTPPNTGDPWIDNLPESYFEMYEEEDAVKPAHYQNNGKDLFEEWFERYNDNGKMYTGKEVFIEIMKSVAERYIRRYPNKSKYDLEKGIYTLERLKEYEELERSGIEQALDDLKNGNISTFESVEDLMNELEEEE